jgi:hypothetical protein
VCADVPPETLELLVSAFGELRDMVDYIYVKQQKEYFKLTFKY